jgi:hypothetical protein
MAENDSVATAAALVSALAERCVPLIMKAKRIPIVKPMNTTTLAVTKVTRQEDANATAMAATIQAANSRNVPSFSEIPTCRVLAVLVIVPAADPGAIESRTWTV